MEDDAAEILKLIENVDPLDNPALDEIDNRVKSYLRELPKGGILPPFGGRYTRSRDVLKSLRPLHWNFDIFWSATGFMCVSAKENGTGTSPTIFGRELRFPTEELAELHVVIQTIEHERKPHG